MILEIEYTTLANGTSAKSADLAETMVKNLGLLFRNCKLDINANEVGLHIVIKAELPKVHAALWEANRWKIYEIAMDGVDWDGVFADAPRFSAVK